MANVATLAQVAKRQVNLELEEELARRVRARMELERLSWTQLVERLLKEWVDGR